REEAPAGDPGEPAVEAIAAVDDGRLQGGRAAFSQVGKGDGGAFAAGGQVGQEALTQWLIRPADDEAAGALVLAFEEGEGAAGARGVLLEASESERTKLEAAELARDALPKAPAPPPL